MEQSMIKFKTQIGYDTWSESYVVKIPDQLLKELGWSLSKEMTLVKTGDVIYVRPRIEADEEEQ